MWMGRLDVVVVKEDVAFSLRAKPGIRTSLI